MPITNPSDNQATGVPGHRDSCKCRKCRKSRKAARKGITETALEPSGVGTDPVAVEPTPIVELIPETIPEPVIEPFIEVLPAIVVPAETIPETIDDEEQEEVANLPAEAPMLLKDRTFRSRVAEICLLRAQGLNNKQIAERMHLAHSTIKTFITRAKKQGLLRYDNPEARLQHELAPLVVDNIEYFLKTPDREASKLKMTIEAAKGLGMFKSHAAHKIEGASQQMAIAIKFEMPEGGPTYVEGHIVGTPKFTPKE